MATDTEPVKRPEADPGATADGGLTRLDLPGEERREDEDLVDDERETS
jgi:hypothetical protein